MEYKSIIEEVLIENRNYIQKEMQEKQLEIERLRDDLYSALFEPDKAEDLKIKYIGLQMSHAHKNDTFIYTEFGAMKYNK